MSVTPWSIVIIDDSPEDRAAYCRYLRYWLGDAVVIHEAATGAAGLALCRQYHPEGVLLDYVLPDMDGGELLRALAADNLTCGTVLLTGFGSTQVVAEAFKAGALDYLDKAQVTADSLRRSLSYAVETAALRRQVTRQNQELAALNQVLERQLEEIKEANALREQAEATLHQSQFVTGALMESVTTQIAVVDRSGTIVSVNDAWRQFAAENGGTEVLATLGVGANYLEVCRRAVDGADATGAHEALEGIQSVLDGSCTIFTLEYPCHSPAQQHWYRLTATAVPTSPAGAVIAHIEITAQKRTQEELRLLETAVTQSNESILITTADLDLPGPQIVYVNPAFTRITGYPAAEVIGKTPRILQGPRTDQATLERLRRNCTAGEIFHGEAINYRKDGTPFFLEWSIAPVADPQGAITHFVATQFDATARKRTEAATTLLAQVSRVLSTAAPAEAATLQEVIAELVPAFADYGAVHLIEADGTLRLAAERHADPAQQALLYPLMHTLRIPREQPDNLLAKVFRSGQALLYAEGLPSPHDVGPLAELCSSITRILAPQSVILVPLTARTHEFGVLTLMTAGSTRRYDDEDLALVTEMAWRIALTLDNRRLFTEEQAARAEAEEAVRVRDQFMSIASHELKTPLTSIQGNAQLLLRRLQRELSNDESSQHRLQVISDQTIRMQRLIDDLLDLTRIETGRLTLVPALIDLVALTERVVAQVRPTLERHTLLATVPTAPLLIHADAMRIEQVFENLIGNAVKYSPQGGVVQVSVERKDTRVQVQVSDSGIGIPRSDLPRLFQRFFRAANAEAEPIRGLGIGLFVVHEIVQQHRGTLEVESEEGRGSSFTISLPLALPT